MNRSDDILNLRKDQESHDGPLHNVLEKENPESKFERANVHLTRETLTSLGTILVKMVLHQVSKR